MLNKDKLILTIWLLLNFSLSYSQQSNEAGDTLFIYETIEVYDTIIVYDTVRVKPKAKNLNSINSKQITILQIDTSEHYANLLIISDKESATIPINSIILNENIKQNESMKKLNFLGVLLFTANSMLFAQTEFGVSAGTGTWWQNSNYEFVERPPLAPMLSTGLFIRQPIIKKMFALKLEVNYAFLISVGEYVYDDDRNKYRQYLYEQWGYNNSSWLSYQDVNKKYGNNLHNLTIPLTLSWNRNKIQPFIGINYYLLNHNNSYTTEGLGLHVGLYYKINKTFSLECNYYLKDYDYSEAYATIKDDEILKYKYILMENNQIRINLVYTFGKE